MSNRHLHGEKGILRIVDELDRVFAGTGVTCHLFGLKSDGMAAVRSYPRFARRDSRADGLAVRQQAREECCAKTDAVLVAIIVE